jgi:hypothetical protein
MDINQTYTHILDKRAANKLIAILSLFYLFIYFFLTPVYKFLEIYYFFPHINFSGLRAILAVITVSILLYNFFKNINRIQSFNRAMIYLFPGIICLIFICFIFFLSYFRVLDYSPNAFEIFLLRVDACLIGYTMLFIAGCFFDFYDSKKVLQFSFILWILFSIFILINSKILVASFFIYADKPDNIINYIFLSNGYLFFAFFALAAVRSNLKKTIVWLLSISCLFLVPSRSNTVAFIFSTIVPILFYFRKSFVYSLFTFFSLFAILILVLIKFAPYSSVISSNELFESSRFFSTNLANDASLIERKEIARINFANLKETWFFGDFMGDIRLFGEDGNETHSYISFLEQFGFIPFTLMISSVIILIYFLYKLRSDRSAILQSTLMLALFFIPLMIFAKGFTSNLIWFLIPRVVMHFFAYRKEMQLFANY